MSKLGVNISARCHELGITQEQLSNMTDLSINYISRLERGAADNVSAKTLASIAKGLKTTMDKLASNNSNNNQHEHEMGYYQKELWNSLNNMSDSKAEQVSKNVLSLINLNDVDENQ